MHIANALIKFWRRMFETGESAKARKAQAEARKAARRKRTSVAHQPAETPFNLAWLNERVERGDTKRRSRKARAHGAALARKRAAKAARLAAVRTTAGQPSNQPTNNARTRKLRGLPTKLCHVHFYAQAGV